MKIHGSILRGGGGGGKRNTIYNTGIGGIQLLII